jgi:hypothetical protein
MFVVSIVHNTAVSHSHNVIGRLLFKYGKPVLCSHHIYITILLVSVLENIVHLQHTTVSFLEELHSLWNTCHAARYYYFGHIYLEHL